MKKEGKKEGKKGGKERKRERGKADTYLVGDKWLEINDTDNTLFKDNPKCITALRIGYGGTGVLNNLHFYNDSDAWLI